MIRDRLIYASKADSGLYHVSLDPPDAPVRRIVDVEREDDVTAIAKRRRARVFWWPPRDGKTA